MTEVVVIVTTLIGIVLITWGTAIAFQAFNTTSKEHAGHAVFPHIDKRIHRLQILRVRVWRWIRRQDPKPNLGELNAALPGIAVALPVQAFKRGGVVSPNWPIPEQIAKIVQRLDNIEAAADSDRTAVSSLYRDVREDTAALSRRLDVGLYRAEQLARDNAMSTLHLQVKALLLVGFGSVLTAVPSIYTTALSLLKS